MAVKFTPTKSVIRFTPTRERYQASTETFDKLKDVGGAIGEQFKEFELPSIEDIRSRPVPTPVGPIPINIIKKTGGNIIKALDLFRRTTSGIIQTAGEVDIAPGTTVPSKVLSSFKTGFEDPESVTPGLLGGEFIEHYPATAKLTIPESVPVVGGAPWVAGLAGAGAELGAYEIPVLPFRALGAGVSKLSKIRRAGPSAIETEASITSALKRAKTKPGAFTKPPKIIQQGMEPLPGTIFGGPPPTANIPAVVPTGRGLVPYNKKMTDPFVSKAPRPKAFPPKPVTAPDDVFTVTKNLFKDINKSIGKTGAFGRVRKTKAELEASHRIINEHLPALQVLAKQQGKKLVDVMRELGIDESIIKSFAKQGIVQLSNKAPLTPTHLGGINLTKMSDDSANVLRELAVNNPQLNASEVISLAARRKLIGPEAKKLADTLAAADPGMLGAANDLVRMELEQVIIKGKGKVGMAVDDILNQVIRTKKVLKETPRAFESRKHFISGISDDIIKQFKEEIAKTKDPDIIAGLEDALDLIVPKAGGKPGVLDYLLELWQAGLLSSPDTILRNLGGNLMGTAIKPFDKFTTGIVDAVKSVGGLRRPRRVFAKEGIIEAQEIVKNIPGGLKRLYQFLRHETPSAYVPGKVGRFLQKIPGIKQLESTEGIVETTSRIGQAVGRRRGAIPGKLGQAIRAPFRPLKAGDEAFGLLDEASSVRAVAYRKAKLAGLKGKALDTRVKELMAKPTEVMKTEGLNDRLEYLFLSKLGGIGSKVEHILNTAKFLKFKVPFFKTIINLGKFFWHRSPAGLITLNKQGVPKVTMETSRIAKAINGTVGLVLLKYWLEKKNVKLVGNPRTKAERESLYRRGLQPNSLVFEDDSTISFNNLEPATNYLSTLAELESAENRIKRGQDTEEAYTQAAKSFVTNIANQSILKGPKSTLDLLFAPEETNVENYVEDFVSSWIPNLSYKAARMKDPYVRETEGVLETIQKKAPFFSEKLPAKVDVFGERIKREKESFFQPVRKTQFKRDPVEEELNRLGIFPSTPRKKSKGIELTQEEVRGINIKAGQGSKRMLDVLIHSPGYQELSREDRTDLINSIISIPRSAFVENTIIRKIETASPEELMELRHDYTTREQKFSSF